MRRISDWLIRVRVEYGSFKIAFKSAYSCVGSVSMQMTVYYVSAIIGVDKGGPRPPQSPGKNFFS